MRTTKVGKKTTIHFTYTEWVQAGKKAPQFQEGTETNIIQYIITETPQDKKEYFLSLGWSVRLASNKERGMKKHSGWEI